VIEARRVLTWQPCEHVERGIKRKKERDRKKEKEGERESHIITIERE
jgi:hypothetical protein